MIVAFRKCYFAEVLLILKGYHLCDSSWRCAPGAGVLGLPSGDGVGIGVSVFGVWGFRSSRKGSSGLDYGALG